jgi:two-component system sensor histidine kinase BaeS
LLSLSTANRTRIAELAALVLLVTMTITTLVAIRITRPLHALAGAARQASGGDFSARVTVRSHDETGIVARAFNEMAEQRQQAEFQRKAMVNDIAHELRTPVSNIRGWLEAAEDGLSDPAEALASLREESLLLAHLIGDLQDLAAADAGELAIRAERVDLADILGNVAQAHRGTADAKGIRLISHSPGELPVTADPIRLRQAVANLVGNAIRHTPADGTVTLTAWPDGGQVVIEVTDTGPGIDPRHLPFLFERFWRADKSRSRQTGGSGLGLAITRKLAEAHHGTVSAANGDAGAVFTLRIPARQPDAFDRPRAKS